MTKRYVNTVRTVPNIRCSKRSKTLLLKLNILSICANFSLKESFLSYFMQINCNRNILRREFVELQRFLSLRTIVKMTSFADEFVMLNDRKVEASTELSRKSSSNFVNLRRSSKNAGKRSLSNNTRTSEIFCLDIACN